jgi:hypothetical protein
VPFPQYRIPVERLKEEWEQRVRMEQMGVKPIPKEPEFNIQPITHPTSIKELWEHACRINEAVAQSMSQANSSETSH